MRLTRLPSRVAGPGIQTVPITNCAVMPTADETALDALTKIRNAGLPRSA